MHSIDLRRTVLALVAAGALVGLTLFPTASAQAVAQPRVTTTAQWQTALPQIANQGDGCYQASYPSLRWKAAECVTAPNIPLVPKGTRTSAAHAGPATVGDGTDYSAVVSGLISRATGTFTNVSSAISEKGATGGSGSQVANSFSLQINSQFFAGSPACARSSNPSSCQAWQQFVYTYDSASSGEIFMQYWLINYNATCPSGWYSYQADCYTNSAASRVSTVTAKQLATVKLTGTAVSGGNDSVSLSVGSGQAVTVTGKDTKVNLAAAWNTTEWGVYGDGGGSSANFGSNNALEARTALTSTSSTAPSCVQEGYTGETNNLTLTATPALGSAASPTMASAQTDGTTNTPSCAVVS
ncbi:hypothetical protein [Catenulispora pinisilvae]|uniref:hypothetical protein n=1 Tax=Catenulispora pinisilvae TaxID=2705253 RepID=UPI001890E0F1|nr:hypothetical protein [Catenulispora pinisilvae]